ncbi:hypothetical protein RI129_002331 [Pyrocoelia pectoralis]|uniref:LysM domain-containing protein n=1 Tax=Pyrocoelia pectoralis TaxID=417401 RepID=A0AAN7VIU1_9COLE
MKQRQRAKIQENNYTRIPSKDSDDSEKVVEEGDTLQALSIRYHCPIAELKRLNNIHRENEIFAKNIIKVPARPFSFSLACVHTSGTSSPKEETDGAGIDTDILNLQLSRELLNIPKSSVKNGTVVVNDIIFNSSVKPIDKNCDNSPITEVHLHEEVRLLPQSVPTDETILSKLTCSGADAGISWIALIVCVIILIVAFPLIYVLYIAEHPDQYYHSHV